MMALEETAPTSKSEDKEKNDLPKKKFYNTVFARKMRNKKLEKLEPKDVLNSCKLVSVEVTRIPLKTVPKIVNSTKPKKRKNLWYKGITKKRIQASNKMVKLLKKNDKSSSTEKSESSVQKSKSEDKSESLELNHQMPKEIDQNNVHLDNERLDASSKSGTECNEEEEFSCRRTIPFVGKLNTREARILNINKYLNMNLKTADNKNKNSLQEKNQNDCSKSNEVETNGKSELSSKEAEHTKISQTSNNSHVKKSELKKKKKVKQVAASENNDTELIDLDASKSSKTALKTKDAETTVNSVDPILEKSSNKSKVMEITLDSDDISDSPKVESNSKKKKSDDSVDTDKSQNNHKVKELGKKTKLVSNKKDNKKSKSHKELHSDSSKDSSTKNKSSSSSNKEKSPETDLPKKSENECNKLEPKGSFSKNTNTEETTKSRKLSVTENDSETCRRTEIYFGKLYPHCSRTVPYFDLVKKIVSKDSRERTESSSTESNISASNEMKSEKTNLADKKNEVVEQDVDSATDVNSKSDANVPVNNRGFKRKHSSLSGSGVEIKNSKKSKLNSPLQSKSFGSKSNSLSSSEVSANKICSLFSTNCKKHNHCPQNHSLDRQCPVPDDYSLKKVVVVLHDVKADPLATKYLLKAEEEEEEKASPIDSGVSLEKSSETIVKTKKRHLSLSKVEETAVKDTVNKSALTSDSQKVDLPVETTEEPVKENQKSDDVKDKGSKDKISDSDQSDSSFSFMTRSKKKLTKTQETPGRKSNNRRLFSKNWDGSDAEVEELSRLAQNAENHWLNESDSSEVTESRTTRSKSRAAGVIKTGYYSAEEKSRKSSKSLSKTPSLKELNEENLASTQRINFEDDSDTEMEEISRNIAKYRKRRTAVLKTPSPSRSPSELNNNTNDEPHQRPSSADPPPTIVNRENDSTHSAMKAPSTPKTKKSLKLIERSKSDIPALSPKTTSPKSQPELSAEVLSKAKESCPRDLKVQLINIETVCKNYKDYSVSDLEMLVSKYVDRLMNSNFSLGSWVAPTNYYKPPVVVPVIEDASTIMEVAEEIEPDPALIEPAEESSALTSLQDAISTLVDRDASPVEERITEAISEPSPKKKKEEEAPSTGAREEDEEDQRLVIITKAAKFTCSLCDKPHPNQEALNEHAESVHPESVALAFAEFDQTKSKTGPKKKKKKLNIPFTSSLQCSMCSNKFETKELLFDHLLTHNEKDLQQAYESAKKNKDEEEAKKEENLVRKNSSDVEEEAKKEENLMRKKSSDVEEVPDKDEDESTTQRPSVIQPPVLDVEAESCELVDPIAVSTPVTLCPCHAHETEDQDLQIEMNILCKSCDVLFRRRDCFETHFRTSMPCRLRRSDETLIDPKLFCSSCPRLLKSLLDMRSHLEDHAKRNVRGTVTFICNICKVAFFGIGQIFYAHWFQHTRQPNFIASRGTFPRLSVVSVLEVSNGSINTVKSQEGFFYIAEHVCENCKLPFSSEQDLQKHKQNPCGIKSKPPQVQNADGRRLQQQQPQKFKIVCDLCKKFYTCKKTFDKHCIERNHLRTPITKFSRCYVNGNDPGLLCSLCQTVAATVVDMMEHWKRVHSPVIEIYSCKTCSAYNSSNSTFDTFEKFERHALTHRDQLITCLVCFANSMHVCEVCKLGFENDQSLSEHKKSHQVLPTLIASTPVNNVTTQSSSGLGVIVNAVQNPNSRMTPIYVQYPSTNPSYVITSNSGNLMGVNLLQPVYSQPPIQLTTVSSQNSPSNVKLVRSSNSSLLRNMLHPAVQFQQKQQQQQQQQQQQLPQYQQQIPTVTPVISDVVTVCIDDSRSNSPASDSTSTISVVNNKSDSSNKETSPTKSYMTIVNPEFETLLGSSDSGSKSSTDKPNSNSGTDDAVSSSNENTTPTPFEVVLVNDELSDNSEDVPIIEKVEGSSNSVDAASANKPQEDSGKSFLRVRSIAELQSIKVHGCNVCKINFNSSRDLELHMQQHVRQTPPTELDRSTPVQMISPMQLGQGNRKSSNDLQGLYLNQIRQKMSNLTTNGTQLSDRPDQTMLNPPMLPNLIPIPQNQQPSEQYWLPPGNNSANHLNYNGRPMPPQSTAHHLPNLLRKSTSRPQPPPYPTNIAHTTVSGRPGAIQLPERNIASALPSTQQPQRPSGAATRIPQQSMPYQGINDNRLQGPSRMPTYVTTSGDSSGVPIMSQLLTNHHPQRLLVAQQPMRTYARPQVHPNNAMRTYQQQPQPQQSQVQFSPNITNYNCNVKDCNFRTDSPRQFRLHAQNCRPQQITARQPPDSLQQRHVSVNQMPERSSRLQAVPTENLSLCEICNCYCMTSADLAEHMKRVHDPVNGQVCCYVCDYCPKPLIFDSETRLREHMDQTHNFFCRICSKRFPSQETLAGHAESMHPRNV